MSSFAEEDVRRLARLARLEVTSDEVALFAQQLGDILAFIRQVQGAPSGPVDGSAPAGILPLRDDATRASLSRDEALSASAGSDPVTGLFKVPRVLND